MSVQDLPFAFLRNKAFSFARNPQTQWNNKALRSSRHSRSVRADSNEITGLEFFDTVIPSPNLQLNLGTVSISMSTTAAAWNTLSTNLAANIGSNNTQVFTGNIGAPGTFPGTLNFLFSSPFFYDLSQGNLLIDMNTVAIGGVFLDANGANTPNNYMSSAIVTQGALHFVVVEKGYGLVTDFEGNPIQGSSLPEPRSVHLLATALFGVAYLWYRRGKIRALPPQHR